MKGTDVGAFRRLAGGNFLFKILALLLAALLWWFVAGESQILVGYVVPLEIRNLPPGMVIVNKIDRQVEVRLSGPPSLIGSLHPSALSASLDLEAARPGRNTIALGEGSVRVPPGIKVPRIYPASVEVVLDRLVRRRIPVVPKIVAPSNVRRRIRNVEVVPPELVVEALPEEFERNASMPTEPVVPEDPRGVFAADARVELWAGHARIVGNPVVRVKLHFR